MAARIAPVTVLVPAYNEAESLGDTLRSLLNQTVPPALVAVDIVPAVQATLEAEAYSAPFAPAGAVPSPDWKYFSARLGLRFRLAPAR